jgi:hypothetical protein
VTKVTIVSRTQMSHGVCIGGLTRDDRRNVRLLPACGEHSHPTDAPYVIGEVWDFVLAPPSSMIAPHVEDQLVVSGRRVALQSGLEVWLRNNVTPWRGGASSLFDDRLHVTPSGKAYVGRNAIPASSVGFWVPTDDLVLDESEKRYQVPWKDGRISVKYVGSDPPAAVIVAGTLVRVSLSRWFLSPAGIDGCWLQISGWYASSRKEAVAPPTPVLSAGRVLAVEAPGLARVRASFETDRREVAPSRPVTRVVQPMPPPIHFEVPTRRPPKVPIPGPASMRGSRRASRSAQDRELVHQLLARDAPRIRGRSAPIVRTPTSAVSAQVAPGESRRRVHATALDDNHDMTHAEANWRARAIAQSTVASIREMARERERVETEQREKRSGAWSLPLPPDWRDQE